MEVKQVIVIESTKSDFNFTYTMPSGATWGNALDAAYEILQQVGKMSQENTDKLKPAIPSEE